VRGSTDGGRHGRGAGHLHGHLQDQDDNIVQAMQQAQADKLDHWNFYQARNIRQEVALSTLEQLKLARLGRAAPRPPRTTTPSPATRRSGRSSRKKDELKKQAEQDQKTYDGLNFHDDQFDLSDARSRWPSHCSR